MYLMDYYTIPVSLAGLPSLSIPCGSRCRRAARADAAGLAARKPALQRTRAARLRARLRTRNAGTPPNLPGASGDVMTTTVSLREKYEAVIGIECHVELKTTSKMFCGCPNEFGGAPNTKSVRCASHCPAHCRCQRQGHRVDDRGGLAFDAEIPAFSKFDRKNYFYPICPKIIRSRSSTCRSRRAAS